MNVLNRLSNTAFSIYKTDGLQGLTRRGASFVMHRFFEYSTYYLYAKSEPYIVEFDQAEYIFGADNIKALVVSSNEDADELEAQGLEFRSYILNAREKLDKGALATCIFVGKELGHIGWIALNQQALDSLDEPPYRVDFANKEAVGTGAWTNPKYREKGLRKYGASMFRRVLRENGFIVRRYAIRKNKIPYIKSGTPATDPCGEGRYIRIVWWKSWKERPLAQVLPDTANDSRQAALP